MLLKAIKPRKALNKAYLKLKCNRNDIEKFKGNLTELLDRATEGESEEFHKNLVADFLRKTYYDPNNFINTKGRKDLVIYNGKDSKSTVGVIIEAKKPTNKAEMLSVDNINVKAFHELILYYLRERISDNNLDLKYIIATNINEWFVFETHVFEKLFAQNKSLVKQFTDFEAGRLAGKSTDFFYNEIAKPFVGQINQEILFTHFDLRDYEKPLKNKGKADDTKLIALFKLFSPEHLLKLPFANDSNNLDKRFYSELLHIIGLTETKQGSKKLIERKPENERNTGSLIENAIIQLDSLDKVSRLNNSKQYGGTHNEKLFAIGLELCITWINRILFLKLLEAQLLKYHRGQKEYTFLNLQKIQNYDDLNSLFFQVLARKHNDRNEDVKKEFDKVPYLNSSLFEPTEIEHNTLLISNLRDDKKLPILSNTVLKDSTGKKRSGELTTLQYLFEFLDAYDFSSEGGEDIQEENKTLINASVLGLIFEKINGYKDGSFFTPGFITMYMCRETIRRAVVQKFNDTKGWQCETLADVYNKDLELKEANNIINSLKICDPAVGSGHFLVSALNEIIAVKNDLGVLLDREGKRLKQYHFEVVNDELVITDEDGELFEYHPTHKESQRVQEALFHEKQTIIENCLFGVDINPNSVKICRLRLWIELLKNAYYKSSSPEKGRWPEAGGVPNLPPQPEGGGGCNLNNLPYLKTFRKNLRNNLTPAEATLWSMLKGKALDGRKFRRQHSVANYILDFYCPEERLAIELDGQGHFEYDQAEYDRERDLFLKHVGIKVLRFENKLVWDNTEGVLNAIKNEFGKQPPRQPQADTPPLKGGEQYHPGSASHPSLKGGEQRELETLPNIDINIKCGNSLISRFALDTDLKQALRKSKWTIDTYRIAVQSYRHAKNREEKHGMEKLMRDIKSDFRSEISANSKEVKDLQKWKGEMFNHTNQSSLFEMNAKEKTIFEKKVEELNTKIKKQEALIEEIKNNKIYDHAFEWRFEFPEVLNDEGDFIGFDVVIGNPPYFSIAGASEHQIYYSNKYSTFINGTDIYCLFIEMANNILSRNAKFSFIISNKWQTASYGFKTRNYLANSCSGLRLIDFERYQVFEEANVDTCLLFFEKSNSNTGILMYKSKSQEQNVDNFLKHEPFSNIEITNFEQWNITGFKYKSIKEKLELNGKVLKDWNLSFFRGITTGYNEAFIIDEVIKDRLLAENKLLTPFIKPLLRGRDISRYAVNTLKLWMIYIPKGFTIKTKLSKLQNPLDSVYEPIPRYGYVEYDEAWNYFNEILPEIANHIEPHKEKLQKRLDKGDYWWELRACAYLEDFAKEKIVFTKASKEQAFAFDNNGNYLLNTSYFIVGDNLKYLLGLLNSKLIRFSFLNFYQGGGIFGEITLQALEKIPIPIPKKNMKTKIEVIVNQILSCKKQKPTTDTATLEAEIDQLVYQLYDLTEDEIKIIEYNVK